MPTPLPNTPNPATAAGIAGLALADPALAARSAAYIDHGTGADILRTLQDAAGDLGALLGQPGRLGRPLDLNQLDDAAPATVDASLAARHALYQQAGADASSIARLARLGKVLAAADRERQLDHTGAAMPTWLQYLLNDALWAAAPAQGADTIDARPAWDVTLIAALLAHDGAPPAHAVAIVFERWRVDNPLRKNLYARLLVPGVLDEHLLAHPDAVVAATGVLSVTGRTLLLQRLGTNPDLLDAFAGLVARLSVDRHHHVCDIAQRYLAGMDHQRATGLLAPLLHTGTQEERTQAVDLLAQRGGADSIGVLKGALAATASADIHQPIRNALARIHALDDPGDIDLPAPPALPPAPNEVLGADALDLLLANRVQLLARLRQAAAAEQDANRSREYQSHHQQQDADAYAALPEATLGLAIAELNGGPGGTLANSRVRDTLALGGRLQARPDMGLLQVLRWIGGTDTWHHDVFQAWLRRQDPAGVDLRQVATLAEAHGGAPDAIPLAGLRPHYHGLPLPHAQLPAASIWPLYAERPGLIDEGLGLVPDLRGWSNQLDINCTLEVLATFPSLPARWLPRVWQFAIGEGKTYRAKARQAMALLPDLGQRICAELGSSKQEVRTEAAHWLAQRNDPAGIPFLHAALAKETRETVSAVMLTALERLGADVAAHLAPAALLAQAHKGLKGKAPAGMAWLELGTAPPCTWLDGSAVDAQIVQWWIILAIKLKEPGGNPLLARYLGLLDPGSRAALGSWALHQFIGHDTAQESLEAGIAWAQAKVQQRYQAYQRYARSEPEEWAARGALTREQVFDEIKREKMAEYLGSAIGEKGLLALAWTTPGATLVQALQAYMRDHHLRRAQIEALVEAASVSDAPAVIQCILAIAQRHRTASVQEKARLQVQRIAERNGWSADQLADRTVPTGGLDDDGRLALQLGARALTVTLDAALKPVLRNEDGAVIAALPAPRQDDPPEAIKEAKQLLATCKKEVKQVVEMQGARLYEAMCTERAWALDEWRTYLQRHPLLGRLAQRLVWLEHDGAKVRAFRPTEDGSLIDAVDDEVTLASGATISLAHSALLSGADAAAWIRHARDYKVVPLFAQMTRPHPGAVSGDEIADRRGWLGDAYTLRSAFTKLGYQRGESESRGMFYAYKKAFNSAGLTVVMGFSGNALPEENLPAALTTLSFFPAGGHAPIALDAVPVALLAEAWGDYHQAAAACTGFDVAWESKVPW
jgi:hypothetical protein